jgi:hypothetical protein
MKKLYLIAVVLGLVQTGWAVSVLPFTESFEVNSSGWVYGTSSAPIWSASGGVDNTAYISAPATVSGSGFGAIVFRGNDANNASGDAFVGNWLTAGVTAFSAYVRHDADVALKFYARLDAGSGRAGSSVDFLVAPNVWSLMNFSIVDSASSFQSYGAGTFATVFSAIQNIQIALSVDAVNAGKTLNVAVDNVSIIPEPGTAGLLLVAGGFMAWRRRKLCS